MRQAFVKRISLGAMVVFYLFAGYNHFRDPEFYLPLIPDYLPLHSLINDISGFVEIIFGIGLIFKSSRNFAIYGIIAMLIAFIPSHIYFIQVGSCLEGGLCVPAWVGWARLVVIHPLLILWAWKHKTRPVNYAEVTT